MQVNITVNNNDARVPLVEYLKSKGIKMAGLIQWMHDDREALDKIIEMIPKDPKYYYKKNL